MVCIYTLKFISDILHEYMYENKTTCTHLSLHKMGHTQSTKSTLVFLRKECVSRKVVTRSWCQDVPVFTVITTDHLLMHENSLIMKTIKPNSKMILNTCCHLAVSVGDSCVFTSYLVSTLYIRVYKKPF